MKTARHENTGHRNMSHERSGRQRGFTLVEILIVVLIMGLLLSIAMPQFIRARETGQAKACQHNLKQILGSKERWAMDTQKGNADTPVMSDLVVPGVYLKSTPVCPAGGTYTLGSLGDTPTCSVGGTPGDANAHLMP